MQIAAKEILALRNPEKFGIFCRKNNIDQKVPLDERVQQFSENGVPKVTCFFRDFGIYELLKADIPISIPLPLRIASVGCSTGEEPYSIRSVLWEHRKDVEIHGYDCSLERIKKTQEGIYEISDVLDKPVKGFEKISEKHIQFTEQAKQGMYFHRHNIAIDGPLPITYDIILLANVLYHYTPKARETILKNIANSVKQNGFLICESEIMEMPRNRRLYEQQMEDISHLGFERMKRHFSRMKPNRNGEPKKERYSVKIYQKK